MGWDVLRFPGLNPGVDFTHDLNCSQLNDISLILILMGDTFSDFGSRKFCTLLFQSGAYLGIPTTLLVGC